MWYIIYYIGVKYLTIFCHLVTWKQLVPEGDVYNHHLVS
jgi:hypothetical protein